MAVGVPAVLLRDKENVCEAVRVTVNDEDRALDLVMLLVLLKDCDSEIETVGVALTVWVLEPLSDLVGDCVVDLVGECVSLDDRDTVGDALVECDTDVVVLGDCDEDTVGVPVRVALKEPAVMDELADTVLDSAVEPEAVLLSENVSDSEVEFEVDEVNSSVGDDVIDGEFVSVDELDTEGEKDSEPLGVALRD